MASSRVELDGGTILSKCDQCREMWQERNERGIEGEPPCEDCWVELKPENEEAAQVFQMVRGQVLTRFNGETDQVVDINHLAIWAMIDGYGIKDRRGCFEKVCRVFYETLKDAKKDES